MSQQISLAEPRDLPGGSIARPNDTWLSYLLLRKAVGGIGVALPFVLLIGNQLMRHGVQASMSGYYYTPMRNIFVGALWALGVFLVTYDGWDRPDRIITNIAGGGAIGVSLFPTTPANHPSARQMVIGDLHLTFACVTFVMLALMSLRFAKRVATPASPRSLAERVKYALGFTPKGDSVAPRWEIITYRVSGVVIVVCILLIYPGSKVYSESLLVLETIMLVAFGTAWVLKGSTLSAKTPTA